MALLAVELKILVVDDSKLCKLSKLSRINTYSILYLASLMAKIYSNIKLLMIDKAI